MVKYSLSELLEMCSQLKTSEERIAFLKSPQCQTQPMADILQAALHPDIQWNLPAGTPPYKRNRMEGTEGRLVAEIRRIPIFLKGSGLHPNMEDIKRQNLFIEMLENMYPTDADLLLAAKDKHLPFKNKKPTYDEVAIAFEGLIPFPLESKDVVPE